LNIWIVLRGQQKANAARGVVPHAASIVELSVVLADRCARIVAFFRIVLAEENIATGPKCSACKHIAVRDERSARTSGCTNRGLLAQCVAAGG
jgi:hypothetical protein